MTTEEVVEYPTPLEPPDVLIPQTQLIIDIPNANIKTLINDFNKSE